MGVALACSLALSQREMVSDAQPEDGGRRLFIYLLFVHCTTRKMNTSIQIQVTNQKAKRIKTNVFVSTHEACVDENVNRRGGESISSAPFYLQGDGNQCDRSRRVKMLFSLLREALITGRAGGAYTFYHITVLQASSYDQALKCVSLRATFKGIYSTAAAEINLTAKTVNVPSFLNVLTYPNNHFADREKVQ